MFQIQILLITNNKIFKHKMLSFHLSIATKGINTTSGSFELLTLGLTLENGGGDRFSSVTMYSNGSGNASINASVAADARCGFSLRECRMDDHFSWYLFLIRLDCKQSLIFSNWTQTCDAKSTDPLSKCRSEVVIE